MNSQSTQFASHRSLRRHRSARDRAGRSRCGDLRIASHATKQDYLADLPLTRAVTSNSQSCANPVRKRVRAHSRRPRSHVRFRRVSNETCHNTIAGGARSRISPVSQSGRDITWFAHKTNIRVLAGLLVPESSHAQHAASRASNPRRARAETVGTLSQTEGSGHNSHVREHVTQSDTEGKWTTLKSHTHTSRIQLSRAFLHTLHVRLDKTSGT